VNNATVNPVNETAAIIGNATAAAENATAVVINETSAAANETAAAINETASAANETAAAINETVSNETAGNQTANATAANMTFWLPEYNNDTWTKDMVVLNLTERGIYLDFELWYNYFFGTNGVVVQNMQAANMTNETVSNETASNETSAGLGAAAGGLAGGATAVPAGMENIAAWIIAQVNMKIAQIDILKYFNATGVNMTVPEVVVPPVAPSGGEVAPIVVMIPPSRLFNASEYQASSTCQL